MSDMLKFSELTPFQKKAISNNINSLNAPNFLSSALLSQHDFYYWRGGSEQDRKMADDTFYKYMNKDVSEQVWWKRPYLNVQSYVYYKRLRLFGKQNFFYTYNPRTMEDVISLAEV